MRLSYHALSNTSSSDRILVHNVMCSLVDCAVLGAFGALTVKTSIKQSTIAGISMGVLGALFLAQPLGTQTLGLLYSPILIVWFIFNIVTGIHNIVVFYPGIFKV